MTSAARGRSMTNIGREITELLRNQSDSQFPQVLRQHSPRIKRILLTRKYKDHNVYNDLGIRITGGKRLSNGDLGAFVTAVNRGKAFETLGEIQENDQVLEWNGIFLGGKTYEEVERIVASSKGEIEVIIKSHVPQNRHHSTHRRENVYDSVSEKVRTRELTQKSRQFEHQSGYWSRLEAPPVPAHRSLSPRYPSETRGFNASNDFNHQRQNYLRRRQSELGRIQIALAYDQINDLLLVCVIGARGLRCREYNGKIISPNPFVKIYLLPGKKVSNKRRTKYIANTANPDWNQTVEYYVNYQDISKYYLEFTVWDYDKYNDNICLGQLVVSLSDTGVLNHVPRTYPLQRPDESVIVHRISTNALAPTTRLQTQSYYNPTSLDLGYPAIC